MKLTYFEDCLSTNDSIIPLITSNKDDVFGIYTFHQKKGRGQYGNSWESLKNLNIAFSIALPTNLVRMSDSLFNFYTALVLRNFVAKLTNTNVAIKWPNDLIINNKKIAGILIEKNKVAGSNYFIIGFGINVLQMDFENLPSASSLKVETRQDYDLHSISENLSSYFENAILSENNGENILKKYEKVLFKKDKVAVFEINNSRQNGIIKNVDEHGFIYIELEKDGLKKFYHKEIQMLY